MSLFGDDLRRHKEPGHYLPCLCFPQQTAAGALKEPCIPDSPAVIEDERTQTAAWQSPPKSPEGPQIHPAVDELQAGKWAGGTPPQLQKRGLRT